MCMEIKREEKGGEREEGSREKGREKRMERKRENLKSLPYTNLTSSAKINTENKLWERNIIFT